MREHKISYGIDHRISLEGQKYLLKTYQKYIKGIYTGIPDKKLQPLLTSRDMDFLNSFEQSYYDEIINYARDLGLTVNFTINRVKDPVTTEHWERIFKIIELYHPNELCTVDKYVPFFRKNCDPTLRLARSFYNTSKIDPTIPYEIHVCKNTILLNPEAIDNTIENRIVINFACPWGCKLCGDMNLRTMDPEVSQRLHSQDFIEDVNNNFDHSLEKYLAYHCWSGYDVNQFESRFPKLNYSYKYANRTNSYLSDYTKVEQVLSNYFTNDFWNFKNTILFNITHLFGIYHNWFMGPYKGKAKTMDMDLFKKYKDEYWAMIDDKLEAAKAKGISFS